MRTPTEWNAKCSCQLRFDKLPPPRIKLGKRLFEIWVHLNLSGIFSIEVWAKTKWSLHQEDPKGIGLKYILLTLTQPHLNLTWFVAILSRKNCNKLGLSWAKLSPSWDWTVIKIYYIELIIKIKWMKWQSLVDFTIVHGQMKSGILLNFRIVQCSSADSVFTSIA